MKKRLIIVLVAVVLVASLAACFVLSEKAKSAEAKVQRIDLLYTGDRVSLAGEIYQLSTKLSSGKSSEKYDIGKLLQSNLDEWDADYQAVLSKSGPFSYLGRGKSLDELAFRRIEIHDRIEIFIADE